MSGKNEDWIREFAFNVIGTIHFKKNEIEEFFYAIGKGNLYELYENKSPKVSYFNAIKEFVNDIGNFDLAKSKLEEILRNILKWESVADKLIQVERNVKKIYWSVPPKNLKFIGRVEKLKEIETLLNKKEGYAVITACVGLGGIGKTSLTAEYTWRNKETYDTVVWFDSETKAILTEEFLRFGDETHIVSSKNKSVDAILTWFESQSNWLIVFDNVENSEMVKTFTPKQGGKIIITSRNSNFMEMFIIELDKYSLEEVKLYLKANLRIKQFDEATEEEKEKFAKELVFHPLAIAQATSYIFNSQISLKKYLEIKRNFETILFEAMDLNSINNKKFLNSYTAVFQSFMISVKKVYSISPKIIDILKISAFMSPDKIPIFLFPNSDDDLDLLKEYSLISMDNDEFFSVHRLVQESLLFKMAGNVKDDFIYQSCYISEELSQTYKFFETFYPLGKVRKLDMINKRTLLPHLASLLNHHNKNDPDKKEEILKVKLAKLELPEISIEDIVESSIIKKMINYEPSSPLHLQTISNQEKHSKLSDALFHFEVSLIEKDINLIEEHLKTSLKILKSHFKDHELIALVSFYLIFHYIRNIKIHKENEQFLIIENLKDSVFHMNLDEFELTNSLKLEIDGFFNGRKNSREKQLDVYLEAYDFQLNFLNRNNNSWVDLCSKATVKFIHLETTTIEHMLPLIKLIGDEDHCEMKFLDDVYVDKIVTSWLSDRQYEVPIKIWFFEILKCDMKLDLLAFWLRLKNSETEEDNVLAKLEQAVVNNDYNLLSHYLKKHPNPQLKLKNGKTLLHIAAEKGLKTVKLLVEDFKVKIDEKDDFERTPFLCAVDSGNTDCILYLMRKGADINAKSNVLGSPLHVAIADNNVPIIKILLSKGADLELVDSYGSTPLHSSMICGNIEVIELLFYYGAQVNKETIRGETAFHTAAEFGRIEVLELLRNKGAFISSPNKKGEYPLEYAIQEGKLEAVKYLITHGAELELEKYTDYHNKAIKSENIEMLRFIIEKCEIPPIAPFNECTPFHQSVKIQNLEMLQILLNQNEIRSINNQTLVYLVATKNNHAIMKLLLEHGMNIDASDIEGETSLHKFSENGNFAPVKFLHTYGSNLTAVNNLKETALHKASSNKITGKNILHGEIVKYLLENEANVNARDVLGETPIHKAAATGTIEILKILIEKNSNIIEKNSKLETPLHIAVKSNNIENVSFIIKNKGYTEAKNSKQETPLEIAQYFEYFDIADILKKNVNLQV